MLPPRAIALVGAAVGAVGVASAQAPASHVIQGDYKIAGYAVKADGTLFGAIETFGEPASKRRDQYRNCFARWPNLGLQIQFYNLAIGDPCAPQHGKFFNATMTSTRWRTAKGLRIRHPSRYIFRYYPRAHPTPRSNAWWSLLTRPSRWGRSETYAALEAKVQNGWVVAFRVTYPAGGD